MNLSQLLHTEGRNCEFKLELPQRDLGFLKTCVAFANGQGGRIVVGISDEEHAVVGVNDETLFQNMDTLTNIISDNCEPAILPNVYPVTIQGKSLIVVEIATGRQRPYYVKSLGMMEGTYIRVAAETRKADEIMVKELMFEGAHRFFDKTVCLGLEASEAEQDALCAALRDKAKAYQATQDGTRHIRDITRSQLLSWGILTRLEDKIAPTNAFALLTGNYLLPSMIQCAVFKGVTKDIFIDKREYEGPIQDQQEEAYQFILRNIRLGARIAGLYRQDIYEIPPGVIRELLVNAVVHRSYLATGNVQVALYDDRLEILSPGKLPLDQSIEAMKNGFSKIRNEALAKAFSYMGLIEGWGSGIPRINSMLKEAGLQQLEISGGDFFLKFTIYRNPDFNPSAVKKGYVGVESQNVGVESQNVGVESRNVGVESRNVGVESRNVGVESRNVGVESRNVGVESRNVGVESQNVGVESRNVGVESQNVGVESRNVGVEFRNVGDCVEEREENVGNKREDYFIVLRLIRENSRITAMDLAMRLHITTRTAERILRHLKQTGRIQREGSDRFGHWLVKK